MCGYYTYLAVHETELTPSFHFKKKNLPHLMIMRCIRKPNTVGF